MTNQRARGLGIRFPGTPGAPNNAITDVSDVAVGHSTIIGGLPVTQTTFTSDVLTSSNRGLAFIDNGAMDPLFTATVQATEEAIINALLAATQVTGPDNFTATKLPTDKLAAAFNDYNPMTAIFLY